MGESPVLAYLRTNLSPKTAVVAYREEADGFIMTAWLTSQADRVRAREVGVWTPSPSTSG